MLHHRITPIVIAAVSSIVLATLGTWPAAAAESSLAKGESPYLQAAHVTNLGTSMKSALGPPRITDYLDEQLKSAPSNLHLSPYVPAAPLNIKMATANTHSEVFGYVNAGNLTSGTVGYQTWNFNDLSTIAVFGLHVLSDGSFSNDTGWNVWNSSALSNLESKAHPLGVKVVPSIIFHDFSIGSGSTWTPMCTVLTPPATDHTVADITTEVTSRGADGFNMDYEGTNQTCPDGQTQAQKLVVLMQRLRASLAGYYISIATYNASYYSGYYFDIPGLNPSVDSFFLMDYDSDQSNYIDEPLKCAVYCFSPTAPLTRYTYNDTNSVAGYLGIGVPASKILLGVPYYGYTACIDRQYGTSRPGPNAVPYTSSSLAHWSVPRYLDSSTTNGQPGVNSFATAYDPYTNADSYSTWYDSDFSCWRESYWSDTYSLGKKYDLVNSNKLRGVGIFTLDYGGGAPELWSLLQAKFGGCTGATLTPAPGTFPLGTSFHYTATAAGCSNPEYEFWLLRPGGSWTPVQGYSSTATFTWNTAGLPAGSYQFVVWVRQHGSATATYEAGAGGIYALSGCATAALSPAPGSVTVGSTVGFTASSTGCPSPEYAFWVLAPGGSWTLKQPYSATATFNWNTSGLGSGTYQVAVWVRQIGSGTATYEAGAGGAYTLIGCTASTLSPAPGSFSVGGTIAFTAGSSGCANPQYEFWVLAPGSSWRMAQAYSPSTTFNWNTSGLAPGTYQVVVWTRQPGSSSVEYDSGAGGNYVLTGCATAGLTPAPGTFKSGTAIAFTATSTGCASPEYAFWVLPPGGSWTLKQPYSPTATFTWTTSGLRTGAYQVAVWARQHGSGSAGGYDVGAGGAYTLN